MRLFVNQSWPVNELSWQSISFGIIWPFGRLARSPHINARISIKNWHLLVVYYCTRRSPVHRTFVTFAFTSPHFILFSLRIAISRHFLSSSKNSAQKKSVFLRSNGIYHNYTDHNFPFLRQPVGRMTSRPNNFPTTELYLSNPSSRSALPPTVR